MKSSINTSAIFRLPLAVIAILITVALYQPARAGSDMRVITTIAPIYSLTAGVMEGVGKPEILLKPGDSPHHFSLRPNDAERISKADIIIATHLVYAYYLTPYIKMKPERKLVFVEALAIPTITLLPSQEPKKSEAKQALMGEYVDMHFWLNPVNAIAYTTYIAELLSSNDPKHATVYQKNATQQIARIKALDATIKNLLGSSPLQAHYASYHPTLAYFEKYYNIQGGKAVTRTPETGASVAEAEALYKAIENGSVRCLFREPEFSPRLLEQAAQKYGDKVRVITLDPLGSTYTLDAGLYDSLLTNVATHLKECSSPAGATK